MRPRILVTGGTGVVGTFVIAELGGRGHSVRALCRTGATVPGTDVVPGDLTDPESLTRAAQGTEGIVHTACTFQDSAIDIAAMRVLLSAWTGGPFVYISSLDVYGLATAYPITEDTPVTETYNDHSRGKIICERLLQEAARATGSRSKFRRAKE